MRTLADCDGPAEPAVWRDLDPGALCDHIESTHHVYLQAALPRLDALLDRVLGAHGQRHPELLEVRRVVGELRDDLEPHLMKQADRHTRRPAHPPTDTPVDWDTQ